ncbi:hypothetical protein ACFS5J_06785 [Flavobacterium chuncheonense]|uniref:YxeA family protein n=1 Tax=Flavobacterium chuncheonense TaxID=2026653 RepID=A0ABW5YL54_9FLAO
MKTKNFNYFILFLSLIWIVYNLYEGNNYDNEIENHGIVTVGKITEFKGASMRPYLRYKYYVNEKAWGSDSPRDEKGEKIGGFYKVIYSSNNHEVSRIYLNEPITDTTLILEAGFSREDLKSISTN